MLYGDDFMFYTFVYAAILGLIPAFIAKNKGRSFGLWYLYGFGLFIVALIHSLVMEDYIMYCRKCGGEIMNGDLFCPKCGSQTNSSNDSSEELNKEKGNRKILKFERYIFI